MHYNEGMKLLLIDDDIFLRDMYELKFTSAGYEVQSVKNAEEALSAISSESYDVIITDMVIPGMSGLDLLRNLKEEDNTKDCVKIVLSNQSEDSDKEAAKEAGANGYLVKADLTPSEVLEQVETIYKQHS